jgi:hypothetical protein
MRYILCPILVFRQDSGQRSRYSDWLRDGRPKVGVRVPVESRIFTSSCRPDGSGAHPASYQMGAGLFPRGKAAGAWSWSLTSNQNRGQENLGLYIHSMSSLRITLPLPGFHPNNLGVEWGGMLNIFIWVKLQWRDRNFHLSKICLLAVKSAVVHLICVHEQRNKHKSSEAVMKVEP